MLEVELNNHTFMPQVGFGTYKVAPEQASDAVYTAISYGYRHIDTAASYGNEAGVGRAIANSGVAREDIFLTTKLWNSDQGYESAFEAFEASLEKLGTDYVDMYLIHWAKPQQGLYLDSWRALIELQKQGKVRSIGVSNFPEEQLREIIEETGVVPVIHQVELHPYFSQEALRAVHAEYGIATQAWSPLGNGSDLLQNPVLAEIAERHGATPAQVVLAWHLAKGTVAIPKSATPSRIEENLASVNVKLTAEDIAAVDALSSPEGRIGADPANIDF